MSTFKSLPNDLVDIVNKDDPIKLFEAIEANATYKGNDDILQLCFKKAATNGKIKCVEATFKAGAKPTLDACWNAAYSEYWNTTKFCFDNGVSVESFAAKEKDIYGFFAGRGMIDAVLYVAERLGKPDEQKMFDMLRTAVCFDDYLPLVKHIVLQWGFGPAQFETPGKFNSPWPLHVACAWRATATMKFLLEQGAGVNGMSPGVPPPGTPLAALCDLGTFGTHPGKSPKGTAEEAADILLAQDGFDVDFRDPTTGKTLLHNDYRAVYSTKLLLSIGADPINVKDNEGKSVLDHVKDGITGAFVEDAIRLWDMYQKGKLKIKKRGGVKRKATDAADDEPDAKKAKVASDDVPVFHTMTGASKVESGMWIHTLGDLELDEDDTGKMREDKGQLPLSDAIIEDLPTMAGDAAELARRLHTELEGCRLESEASCPWTSFVITIPSKQKKATFIKLIQLAMRAPKASLQTKKLGARTVSFFEEDEAGESSTTASTTMKENLTGIVRLEYKGEPVSAPVFVVGKTKDGSALVGAFAIRVWT